MLDGEAGSIPGSERKTLTHFLLGLCALNLALCALIAGARGIGAKLNSPAIAALGAFRCQPQPCWNGILLAETTVAQAEARLKADPRFPIVFDSGGLQWAASSVSGWRDGWLTIDSRDGHPRRFLLMVSPAWGALHLGDALALFGPPIAVCSERLGAGQLLFDGDLVLRVASSFPQTKMLLNPDLSILSVQLGNDLETFLARMPTFDEQARRVPWRGLTRVGTYQPCN